jgi:PAS domain S-box-containing protein
MKITSDKNTKKQLLLLINGSIITIVIGAISDVILPYALKFKEILRIGVPMISVQSLCIFMAVKKYNFLSVGIEEAAKDLFINLQDGIIISDNNGHIIQMNNAAKELLNLQITNTANIEITSLIENYDVEKNYKKYETKIRSSGEQRLVSLSQATIRQYETNLGKILIVSDITDSKKAEQELRESKTKLESLATELVQANVSLEQKVAERTRSLRLSNEQLQREILERQRAEEQLDAEKERLAVTLGSIGDGVITTDTAGKVVLLNKVAEQLTGWSYAEALGQQLPTVFPIVDEKTREPCEDPVEEALHTDTIISRLHHSILRARDNTEHTIAESAAPIHAGDGNIIGVVIVFRDMTDRRRMEEELIKADKLESIGIVAAGIAHDFNNILTAILGNVSLAKMYANPEEKVFARLINAEKAALQAQNLTQQLLTFSKGGTLVRRTSSIIDLIKDSIDFSIRGANVRCELTIAPGVWPVDIDEGGISQVINNLLINANQAMPDGGIIEVQVENVELTDESIEVFLPLPTGKYVRLSVKDHGIGIPEENLQKIFDPYFTTKQKGSGLGLFTCYSIVKKHDGYLAVESSQGVGTTFHVYIPASHKQLLQSTTKEAVQHAGTGRILVMEDEEIIRDVTGDMLSHYGYDVTFARDGTEAIGLYRHAQESGVPFNVILMDLTIPGGMGGRETIKKILEIDPHAKAIVASGYANDPIVVEFQQYGFCGRIVKPYKSEELHETLYRIMHGTSS